MITFKCKMCGGDLRPEENATICECEYCGSIQTIPTADNEKKGNLFNRANRLRMAAEYNKAAAVYASITAEFPEEAEAYWGLCLCKYGIEYVEDPATAKKIPTCHRTRSESIMDDSDFEQACENADAIAKRVYREEAKAIDRLQRDILSVVATEPPYDVFICYKETGEDGERTEDSVLAQDIYDALTAKGLKVFFARISLEDKLGQQYEPYIYAALYSAKVMLAIGTQFEYYDAVWVKNEWSRFLDMMKEDKGKTLIPCYKGIDAYDMPREFKNLQAQDMGKLGWVQDLTRGVMKLCQKDAFLQGQTTMPIVQNNSPTVDSLLRRAMVFIEDQKWDEARTYADKVLDMEVENGQAYLVKLMADLEVAKEEKLKEMKSLFDDNDNYRKIMRFGDEELKRRVAEYLESVRTTNTTMHQKIEQIKGEYEQKKRIYAQKKKDSECAEQAFIEVQSQIAQMEGRLDNLRCEKENTRGLFERKKREALEAADQWLQQELAETKLKAVQKKNDLLAAQQQEIPEPDAEEYYYELGNAYYDARRYEEAYEYYDKVRGYADVDSRIENLAKLIPNVDTSPGIGRIIDELSQIRSAQDMIQKLDSSRLSHESFVYKQIMEVLRKRAQIERMYGVQHDSTMTALRNIGIMK